MEIRTISSEEFSFNKVVQAMGLVFGDIGTSPLYTFTVIFLTTKVNAENILSILSLILWTLILLVTTQYAYLAMSLSKRGEGGTIVLFSILKKFVKSSRTVLFFSFLTYLGVSLIIGDSVITPAISMLSAVEGLQLIPRLDLPQAAIIVITIIIAIVLFSIQNNGAEKISKVFGPVMVVWFLSLGIFGAMSVFMRDSFIVFQAFNPLHGINFLLHNGFAGFFVLSEVILCATGAEALYADMGQIGRKPIIVAWCMVFCALAFNYLGQGAFLLAHPQSQNIMFEMIFNCSRILYLPFVILAIFATIIASQAMISGLFSIIYQGINTRIFPLFKIEYMSDKMHSQIYIPAANWFLFLAVVLIILIFKQSSSLAAAYGLAVMGTMTITGIMLTTIFFARRKYFKALLGLFLTLFDMCYFGSTLLKIPHGAYWSLIISSVPLALMLLYVYGHKALYRAIIPMDKVDFLRRYKDTYEHKCKIEGTALFFTQGIEKVPPYIVQTMFTNNIIYTDNIFISIIKTNSAFGLSHKLEDICEGLSIFRIYAGYMEVFSVEKVLKEAGIYERAIFYGMEDIETNNVLWRIFATIKKLLPSFVKFYNLPKSKIHGVVTQINM